MPESHIEPHPDTTKRLPYVAPVLRVYGTLPDVTRHVSGLGVNKDGGAGAMSKTH
jgi:hypothetical protein